MISPTHFPSNNLSVLTFGHQLESHLKRFDTDLGKLPFEVDWKNYVPPNRMEIEEDSIDDLLMDGYDYHAPSSSSSEFLF